MTLLQQLLNKKNAERLTVKEIGNILGIPITRINGWIRNNTEPKHSDGIKISKWINGEDLDIENEVLNEEKVVYQTAINKDLSLKAIVNLTESNQIMANNNSRLITLLEEKEKKSTVYSDQESFSIAPETVQALLQVFGEVATGKRWKSKAEFEAYVNTLSFDNIMGKQVAGK